MLEEECKRMREEKQPKARPYGPLRWFSLISFLTLKWLILFIIFGGLLAGGVIAGYVAGNLKDEEIRPQSYIQSKIDENALTGYIYFNDETLVGQLRTDEDRIVVTYDEIPPVIIDALTSTEDKNFFEHSGIDMYGLGRAVKEKLFNEDTQTGGSTLTQQLARRVFLSLDKTDSRKIKEIFLSIRMERYLSKKEIITAYLNKMPFGSGSNGYQVFGIKAAAKGIFGVEDLYELNLAQAAYLAGLPQLPSVYSAFTGTGEYNEKGIERAKTRQKEVLSRMLANKKITKEQHDEALAFDIRASIAEPTEKAYNTYPYLMLEAEKQAAKALLLQSNSELTADDLALEQNQYLIEDMRDELLRGGYHVYTTIDKDVYDMMREIARDEKNFSPFSETKGLEQAAAMLIDHKTGAIISMLECRDFYVEQMNYATQMVRQPGSTMKTIAAYLPAIEKGLVQPGTAVDDSPIILQDGQKGFHIPLNSNRNFFGLVTAREALNRSLNIPAIKIFNEDLTIPVALDFVKELGITTLTESDYYAKTGVIGGLANGTTVEELTNAYGSIPNNGVFNDAYMISKIVDGNGKIVYEHKATPKTVFSEQSAFLMTDMLKTVISSGQGTAASLRGQLKSYGDIEFAGKTGSTQSYGDVWFVGFTPDVTLGVWAGYEKPIHTLSTAGRTRARTLWATIMNNLTEMKPELFETKKFVQPEGVKKATVSSTSGLLPSSLNSEMGLTVTDWFNVKYIPKEVDETLVKMKIVQVNGVNYVPNELTPDDMLLEKTLIKRKVPLDQLMIDIQAAQSKMSSGSRRDMSIYVPDDAGMDAPSIVDPRADDGQIPNAPANVRLNGSSGSYTLTFDASSSNDVVGYRVFASINGGEMTQLGSSILTGETKYSVSLSLDVSKHYAIHVVAVDVVGKVSNPSLSVTTGFLETIPGVIDPNYPDYGGPDYGGYDPDSNNGGSDLTVPQSPTNVSAIISSGNTTISWAQNSVSDQVIEYNIYHSLYNDGIYNYVGTSSNGTFTHSGVTNGGAYQVTAVNTVGESAPSISAIATH